MADKLKISLQSYNNKELGKTTFNDIERLAIKSMVAEIKPDITIDELLTKIPNKYELAIVSGKIAKKEFAKGKQKSEIMDEVFKDIMDDEVEVVREINEENMGN